MLFSYVKEKIKNIYIYIYHPQPHVVLTVRNDDEQHFNNRWPSRHRVHLPFFLS